MTAILGFGIDAPSRPSPDEDALTMSIAAARALPAEIRQMLAGVSRLALASTALPYTRRVQAGLITAALGLPVRSFCLECCTSDRAATEALLALGSGLVIAADGRGAAAVLLAPLAPVPPFPLAVIETHSSALAEWPGLEFTERGATGLRDVQTPDYTQAAYLEVVLAAVQGLSAPGQGPAAPALAVVAAPSQKLAQTAASAAGVTTVRLAPPGAAGPLIGLAAALQEIGPGERVLLVAYGPGSAADALLVRKER